MRESGKKIRLTEKAHTSTLMERYTEDSGGMINRMEKARKLGLMEASMRGSIKRGKRMVMENSYGQMGLSTKVNGNTIECKGRIIQLERW